MTEPDWRAVGAPAAFREGILVGRRLLRGGTEVPVVVVRRGEALHAFVDRCPHKGAPFSSMGHLSAEGELVCGWHLWTFCLTDGRRTGAWLIRPSVPRVPVRVEATANGSQVEVDIADVMVD